MAYDKPNNGCLFHTKAPDRRCSICIHLYEMNMNDQLMFGRNMLASQMMMDGNRSRESYAQWFDHPGTSLPRPLPTYHLTQSAPGGYQYSKPPALKTHREPLQIEICSPRSNDNEDIEQHGEVYSPNTLRVDSPQLNPVEKLNTGCSSQRWLLLPHSDEGNEQSLSPQQARASVPFSDLSCSECSRNFLRRSDLKRHQNQVHEQAERAFPCRECSKAFYYAKDLRRHRKTHSRDNASPEQSYKCTKPGCEAVLFGRKDNLKRHMSKQHATDIYMCPERDCLHFVEDPSFLEQLKEGHEAGHEFLRR